MNQKRLLKLVTNSLSSLFLGAVVLAGIGCATIPDEPEARQKADYSGCLSGYSFDLMWDGGVLRRDSKSVEPIQSKKITTILSARSSAGP